MAILELCYEKLRRPSKSRPKCGCCRYRSLVICDKCKKIRTIEKSHAIAGRGVKFCFKCTLSDPEFRQKRKIKIDKYLELAKEKNLIFIGPVPNYIHEKTWWQCPSKHLWAVSFYNLKFYSKENYSCTYCYHEKLKQKRLLRIKSTENRQNWILELLKWKRKVEKIWGYYCQKCGIRHSSNNPLNAHHIFDYKRFISLRFDPENGIPLCKECHAVAFKNSFHSIYGWKSDIFKVEKFIGKEINEINKKILIKKAIKELFLTKTSPIPAMAQANRF